MISKIVKGDKEAFRLLYNHYFHKVYLAAKCIVKSDYYAEEVTSEVFITLWNRREVLNSIENISAYINVCVRNGCLRTIKANKRFCSLDDDEEKVNLKISVEDSLDSIYNEEIKQRLNVAINQLPLRMKQVFILIKMIGYSYKEVAGLLNITESTINNHLNEAVIRLRKSLKDFIAYL